MSLRHLLGLALYSALFTASLASAQTYAVLLRFADADTEQPLPVRAGLFDGNGNPVPPFSEELNVFQNFGWRSYFYSDSLAAVHMEAGALTVRAGRGFEYFVAESTLTVVSDTTLTLGLKRFIDMKSLGWYSGDTHVHLTHPPLVYNLLPGHLKKSAHGEDLNFVNSMEDPSFFSGDPHPYSTPDHILYFSKEQRNAHFSHMTVLGLQEWIPGMGCADSMLACGRTLDGIIYDTIHDQGPDVAVIAAHPLSTTDVGDITPWPGGGMWRAMPLDLVGGDIDAMDLLSYSNVGVDSALTYYEHALNAGFRLPPSAGTDAALGRGNTQPPGGFRVFVMPPAGEGFNLASWVAGLRAGRSFVSNYPLITEFSIDGAMAGDVVMHNGQTLQGTVTVWCPVPMDSIQIIANSEVIHTFFPHPDSLSFSTNFTLDPAQATWVVARVRGLAGDWHMAPAPHLFAQTAPIYLEAPPLQLNGPPPGCAAAATFFLDMLARVDSTFDVVGNFPGGSEAAFDSAMAVAVAYFSDLHAQTTTGVTPHAPPARDWWLALPRPNPFRTATRIEYAAPTGARNVRVNVYDAAGRRVRRLAGGSGDGIRFETQWDGRDARGKLAASGVYFIRVEAAGMPLRTRKVVLVR